jgi:thymidylate synthase
MKNFTVILATSKDKNGNHTAIGNKGGLPWPVNTDDMKHFRSVTTTSSPGTVNAIIMGKNTFMSIGNSPLLERVNIVISSKFIATGNVLTFKTLDEALWYVSSTKNIENCFVIGGAKLYDEAIIHPKCDHIIQTKFDGKYEYDTKIRVKIPPYLEMTKIDGNIHYYSRTKYPESGERLYMKLLAKILKSGFPIEDRTGVGTCAIFGESVKYNIICINPQVDDPRDYQYRVPMFTTKKMFYKGVIGELLWFFSGATNVKYLQDNGIKIWNPHSSKKYLESRGLSYDEGEIGPCYGYQWVNWNGEGINQIQTIIDQLQTNPRDRRMVLNAWNVSDLSKMVLPPCHIMYIFDTTGDVLNCSVTIRSNDMFLGHPFNVLSAAIFTILLSRIVGMMPGQIMINITNAHIYRNHLDQIELQLTREPYEPPLLQIQKNIKSFDDMKNLEIADFIMSEYKYHPTILGPVAV